MKRRAITASLSFLIAITASGTVLGQTHVWSESFGGILHVGGRGIEVDGDGNVFVCGLFQRTAQFGGATMTALGVGDVFVARYDEDGGHLWSKQIGGGGLERSRGIAVDANNRVYVTGFFERTVDFGGGPLESAGLGDIFLACYDAGGNHVWSRRFGGVGSDTGVGVAIDVTGNVVLTGEFQETANFGGGPMASAGSWDAFVVVLDSEGNSLWARSFGAGGEDRARGVTFTGSGDVVVTGEYEGLVNFGGGPLGSAGLCDIFLVRYNAAGGHVWSRSYGQGGPDRGFDVDTDPSGNILITGQTASGDFGGGPVTPEGIYLVKLSGGGDHIWSKGFFGNMESPSVAVDGAGNVVISGEMQTTVDFGGGPLSGTLTTDVFVARFDPSGDHLWSNRFGDDGVDRGRAVAADPMGNIYVTGHFQNTLDFGGELLMSSGNVDLFIAKFGNPVAVAIQSFTARAGEEGISLRGLFASNLPVKEVNLYRARESQRMLLYRTVASSGDVFSYEDTDVEAGRTYHYRIGVVDGDGEFFSPIATARARAFATVLLPGMPNPFNPETTIPFTLESAAHVTLAIYDATGRLVTTLVDEHRSAGRHRARWDGADDAGDSVSSGVYFCRMRAGNVVRSQRMVLLK